jgi:hypothetical protein
VRGKGTAADPAAPFTAALLAPCQGETGFLLLVLVLVLVLDLDRFMVPTRVPPMSRLPRGPPAPPFLPTPDTAASIVVATWEDEGKVATTLGNSPSILDAHYRELVSKGGSKET